MFIKNNNIFFLLLAKTFLRFRTLPIHHLQDMSSDPSFKWATPGNGSFQTMIGIQAR